MQDRVIGVEVWCDKCQQETRYNDADQAEYEQPGVTHHCAHCDNEDVFRSRFITCHCGTTVYLDGDTQCEGCGQWFNGFGQELKDPSEWGEDDDDD